MQEPGSLSLWRKIFELQFNVVPITGSIPAIRSQCGDSESSRPCRISQNRVQSSKRSTNRFEARETQGRANADDSAGRAICDCESKWVPLATPSEGAAVPDVAPHGVGCEPGIGRADPERLFEKGVS